VMSKTTKKTKNQSIGEPASGSVASACYAVMACSTVAEQIATDILTVDILTVFHPSGIECDRAQMMLRNPDGTERNMGGRNKSSIVNTILPHLERLLDRHNAQDQLPANDERKPDE